MSNHTGKTISRKTTVYLSVILVLLVLFALTAFFLIPANRRYYLTHFECPIHGGMTKELKDSELYKDMRSGRSFCFLGDSITAGTATEGIPWYQPLTPYIKGNISNLSCGGWMAYHILDVQDEIPSADVYVIAIGVNDIALYKTRDASRTPDEFTARIEELTEIIRSRSQNAKIYFISPWIYFSTDDLCNERGVQFRAAYKDWCSKNDYIFIDPLPVLSSEINSDTRDYYMIDEVHPNTPYGTGLYSYAVLKTDHERKNSKR